MFAFAIVIVLFLSVEILVIVLNVMMLMNSMNMKKWIILLIIFVLFNICMTIAYALLMEALRCSYLL